MGTVADVSRGCIQGPWSLQEGLWILFCVGWIAMNGLGERDDVTGFRFKRIIMPDMFGTEGSRASGESC